MSDQETGAIKEEPTPIPLAKFLEGSPPGNEISVTDLAEPPRLGLHAFFAAPDIQLHCGCDSCNGTMFFRCTAGGRTVLQADRWHRFYVTYRCSNCQTTEKTFALSAHLDGFSETSGDCSKFGELPEYGPPTPARLLKLIGPDRDIFLKGRRCENQGLGIGAFVYYRRVVENQKNRILDEIITVAKKLGATAEAIQELEAAKAGTQFRKALASVKDSIPQALLIDGHNPLQLLHSALSDGLHDRDDSHCLEQARSIRGVLAELSERLSHALKDEAELNRALSHLLNRKKEAQT